VDDAFALLPELPSAFERLAPAHQSDIFRVGALSKYGGMYVDADTFVLKSLAPLFELLANYEYVGIDWRPPARPRRDWAPLAIGILGPCRPALEFMLRAYEEQQRKLASNASRLSEGRNYPFGWEDLLRRIVVPSFVKHPPHSKMFDGASTWCALVGGPSWKGGRLGHPLKKMAEIGNALPDTELLSVSNSLLPSAIRNASVDELMLQDTILAHLLRQVRGNTSAQKRHWKRG